MLPGAPAQSGETDAVGLYITALIPVTIARSLSDTFAGIAPSGIIAFICAQFVEVLIAVFLAGWFRPNATRGCSSRCKPTKSVFLTKC